MKKLKNIQIILFINIFIIIILTIFNAFLSYYIFSSEKVSTIYIYTRNSPQEKPRQELVTKQESKEISTKLVNINLMIILLSITFLVYSTMLFRKNKNINVNYKVILITLSIIMINLIPIIKFLISLNLESSISASFDSE